MPPFCLSAGDRRLEPIMPRRILVPLDRSHRSEAALNALPEVCDPADEIMLIAVAQPGQRRQTGTRQARAVTRFSDPSGTARLAPGRESPVFETEEEVRERQMAELSTYLNARADTLQRQGFRVAILPVVDQQPARAIIESAKQYRPDVIVMVRRTLDPRRFLFGSVSSRVARADVAPLLLLPVTTSRQSP